MYLNELGTTCVMRSIKKVHDKKSNHWVGNGFCVQTLFTHHSSEPDFNYAHTDPFLLMDYGEPIEFEPNPNYDSQPHGITQHPHKGFETVTIAYAGEVSHADSTGNKGIILEGDVQWMTAGRGIMHEELHSSTFGQYGGVFSVVQLWVNLPQEHKLTAPNYQSIKRADMPVFDLYDHYVNAHLPVNIYETTNSHKTTNDKDKIGHATIIAGSWQDKVGTVITFTPMNLWDIELHAIGSTSIDIPSNHNLMLMVREGELLINDTLVTAGKLIQFEAPVHSQVDAQTAIQMEDSITESIKLTCFAPSDGQQTPVAIKLLLMSGEPIGEPIAGYGPFVMTTPEELKQTFRDYKNGNFV